MQAPIVLEISCFNGDGSRQDRPLGFAWLTLAVGWGKPEYFVLQACTFGAAADYERKWAGQLLQELRSRYADNVVAMCIGEWFKRRYARPGRNSRAMTGGPGRNVRLRRLKRYQTEALSGGCFEGWKARSGVGKRLPVLD